MVKNNKIILRAILLASYIFLLIVLIFLISTLFNYLNTGADRSKILHTEIKTIEQYSPKIYWALEKNEESNIDEQTLKELEKDYLNAWFVKQIAFKTNSLIGIKDHYTKKAKSTIFKNIKNNKKDKITIESTSLQHHVNIQFFNKFTHMAVLKDTGVVEYKKILKNNVTILQTTEKSNYTVILLLEDGVWRIRHLTKESSSELLPKSTSLKVKSSNIKGINYYPQKNPWDLFGKDFNLQEIKKDLEIIKNADLNVIRIFIPYEDFGKANVKETKLKKLEQVLQIAKKNELKVIVTLFDFYGNYDVLDWTLTQKHLHKIISRFKNNKTIFAWDIKNEPDLDFSSRKKENVIAWLKHMILYLRSIDKTHPVTIGWSNTESAPLLENMVDFISFHYYKEPRFFEEDYLFLRKKTTGKPLFLGEFGFSSYQGFWRPTGNYEYKQATYHKEMQLIIKKNKIPFLSWTLYDFDTIPSSVVGVLPWRKNLQKKFGFISNTGVKKPAYKYISSP